MDEIGVRGGTALAGVFGADAISLGTRLERTRIGGFFTGPSVRSMAVAGRAGGGPGEGGGWDLTIEDPGEAVCARGGGGGGDDVVVSGPAYDRCKRIALVSYEKFTHTLIDPTLQIFVVVKRTLFTEIGFDRPRGPIVSLSQPAKPSPGLRSCG